MTDVLDSKRIVFGFSQKTDGNMKLNFPNTDNTQTSQNIKKFCARFTNLPFHVVTVQQVHNNKISIFDKDYNDKTIMGADGLITNKHQVFLVAAVADCLPIIFYSKNPQAIGIVHAGWKGTLLHISSKMINILITKFKVSSDNIFAIFGPSVSSCCYEVKNDVFLQFQKFFDNDSQICQKYQDRMAIDLRAANISQLISAGIQKENIFAPIYCTSCQNDKYFSYRKEKEKLAGEMAAVVAIDT